METQTSNQQTITTAQVTGLLNYWQKIIDYLWRAVETTIADLAVTRELSEARRVALAKAVEIIDPIHVGPEVFASWQELSKSPEQAPVQPTMDDLANPKEETIQ